MVYIGRSWSLLGIIICVLAALIAPFVTHPEYNWLRHTTGELAGQQMPNAWIMRAGYVSLGFGIFFDALEYAMKGRRDYIPFLIFGILMIGVGAFYPRSIDSEKFFAAPFAYWHGYLFVLSAIALITGMMMRIQKSDNEIFQTLSYLAILVFVASGPLIYFLPQFAGLIERMSFFISSAWLLCFLHQKPVEEAD